MLVSEDEKECITKLILIKHPLQFFPSLNNTVAIVAVDDENDTLRVLEIMSPERSDLVLATNVPHGKLDVLIFDSLDVESDCRDSCDDFTKFQLVQDGSLFRQRRVRP